LQGVLPPAGHRPQLVSPEQLGGLYSLHVSMYKMIENPTRTNKDLRKHAKTKT
jgi:hypothetical protein